MLQRHLKLTVGPDDVENPADEDGWKLYSFNTRHKSFKHPENFPGVNVSRNSAEVDPKSKLGKALKDGYAFWLGYYEHGQCLWFRSDKPPLGVEFQWDGVRYAGLLIWEQPRSNLGTRKWTYDDRAKDADGFLKNYTAWANGEGYYYSLEDDQGDLAGGCGGFYDLETVLEAIKEDLGDYPGWPIVLEGDLADSMKHHTFDGHDYVDEEDLEELPEPEYAI